MTYWTSFTSLNKRIKYAIVSGVAVLFYAMIGFLVVPLILKPIVIDTLTEKLDRQSQLTDIDFNPFTLSITLKGLNIVGKHRDKLAGFDLLTINFQALPLIQKTIAFDEIIINKPEVTIVILANGEYNFGDILLKNTSPDNGTESENKDKINSESAWVLSIDKFRHNGGIINFSDQSRTSTYHHKVEDITVALNNFSTKPGDNNLHHVQAKTSQGTELNWHGNFSLSPLKSSGDIRLISKLHVISDYLQERTAFTITEGTLKVNTHYDFNFKSEEPQFNINDLNASISALEIRRQTDNKKIITLDDFSVSLEQMSSIDKKIIVKSISSEGTIIAMNRDETSKFDIEDLFVLQSVNESIKSAPAKKLNDTLSPSGDSQNNHWDLEIKSVSAARANIVIEDNAVVPAAIHDVTINSLAIENLKPFTDEVALLSFNLGLNEQGVISTQGTIKPKSKYISLVLNTEKISLNDFQPYINSVANIEILSGALATNLNINIDAANTVPLFRMDGDIKISTLNIIDSTLGEGLLRWKNLLLKDLQFSYPEQNFSLAAVNIDAPYLRFAIHEGSKTNIQQVLATEESTTLNANTQKIELKAKADASSENKKFTAEIDKINIRDGVLDFSDSSLSPKFTAGIYSLQGDIIGLSSNEDSRATIDLKGKVDRYAPVIIKGAINPLSHDAFTDIDMIFRGIELTTFTPYSGKFAGYKIDKGKLSLGLNYKLANNKLIAENRVTLDQLTLGDIVDSEGSTSLPVKFALSLLKDANGVIAFNLPIRGDIDNPDFKYSSLVWGALGNMITGIISSPFKALANLVEGDAENIDRIIFTANSFELNKVEQAKLHSLAAALLQRPSLYIEIRGLSSNLIDHDEMAYEKTLSHLQLPPRPLSAELTEDEKAMLIAYDNSLMKKTEQINSTDTAIPQAKNSATLTKEEQERVKEQLLANAIKRILAETDISEAEYLLLAKKRALAIQKYLIETAKVPSLNVFLLDSHTQVSNEHVDIEQSQVTLPLSLKAK